MTLEDAVWLVGGLQLAALFCAQLLFLCYTIGRRMQRKRIGGKP